MPLIPNGKEKLARFVYSSSHIRNSNNSIRYTAFLPNPLDNQSSVFRISGILEPEIWNLADLYVTPNQSSTLKGRADINSENILKTGLRIMPKEPPYRHANIFNWTADKSKNKLIALELEKLAVLHRR